jgi:hypothetical protein
MLEIGQLCKRLQRAGFLRPPNGLPRGLLRLSNRDWEAGATTTPGEIAGGLSQCWLLGKRADVWSCPPLMSAPRFPVLVEASRSRIPAGFSASKAEEPFRISMRIREQGLVPYKVRFDSNSRVWVVSVIDWRPLAAE